ANKVIREEVDSKSTSLESMEDHQAIEFPQTNLVGEHQKRNAALAYRAVLKIAKAFPVEREKVRKALGKVSLEGRWQLIEGNPSMILDACHNQEGAIALQENLRNLRESVVVWLGASGEERALEVIKAVTPYAQEIRLFEIEQPRACSVSVLKKLIPENFLGRVTVGSCANFDRQLKEVDESSTLLITGSIYLVGDFLSHLRKHSMPLGSDFQDVL
ncbi:MAG: hypothetical protein VYA10_09990, partial [Verrucomicrobiota bacterium]|nr:hypothetical protein [Verrucomicrobiota bacterium]